MRKLAVLACALCAVAACSSTTKASTTGATVTTARSVQASGSSAAANDVTVGACQNDSVLNLGQATVTITNHSSKPSTYLVTISADSPDGKTQAGTGDASAQSLGAGQSTTVTAQFTTAIPAGSVCKVAEVQRFAS